MVIEQAFGKLLTAASGITATLPPDWSNALVRSLCPAAQVFAPLAPQSQQTWPVIVYRTVPPQLRDPMLGPTAYNGQVRTRFRVFVSGQTMSSYALVKRLNGAVQKALLGFQGTIEDVTVSPVDAVEIQGIFAHTTFNVDDYDEKTKVLSVISDYDVWHDE